MRSRGPAIWRNEGSANTVAPSRRRDHSRRNEESSSGITAVSRIEKLSAKAESTAAGLLQEARILQHDPHVSLVEGDLITHRLARLGEQLVRGERGLGTIREV